MIETREMTGTVDIPLTRGRRLQHVVSPRGLRQALGALWFLDGLLQLQPSMFTKTLISQIMRPAVQGQPAIVAGLMQPGINLAAHHIVPVNATIALVQLTLGMCLLSGWCVRPVILTSIAWSFAVWCGGEGMGMLLTGQASTLTGAPGAVLLYALLGAAAYPLESPREGSAAGISARIELLHRHLRLVLAGFWGIAAALQLQPYWWQPGQIARSIVAVEARGTLNGRVFGPSLGWLAHDLSGVETIVNVTFIVAALGLAAGLAVVRPDRARPLLIGSIVLSSVLWWATQSFGQILTGTATDVNTGPLLVLLALACWPITQPVTSSRKVGRSRTWRWSSRVFPAVSQASSRGMRHGEDAA